MSDSPLEKHSGPPVPPPSSRGGCLAGFVLVIGIVLMLPGFCVLVYVPNWGIDRLMMFVLALAVAGAAMIWAAVRNFLP